MSNNYRGIAAMDFDGTLYSHRTGFSERNRKVLLELEKQKICRAVVTGRNLASFMKVTKPLNLPIDYLVFSSGAGVLGWETGKLLKKSTLLPAEVSSITSLLIREKLDFMIQHEIPDNHNFHYHRESAVNRDFEARMAIYKDGAIPLTDIPEVLRASQFIVVLPPGKAITQRLRAALERYSLIRATSPIDNESTWLEIFPGDVHKGTGARWLQNYLDLLGKPTMAVGNDYNDEDMLEWTDWAWVVDNAPPELKARFRVTSSCEKDGVSSAVKQWLGSVI